jgi:hypothetical protein
MIAANFSLQLVIEIYAEILLPLSLMRESDAPASLVEIVASDRGPRAAMFVAMDILLCELCAFPCGLCG